MTRAIGLILVAQRAITARAAARAEASQEAPPPQVEWALRLMS